MRIAIANNSIALGQQFKSEDWESTMEWFCSKIILSYLQMLVWEVTPHPLNSPDFAQSDFLSNNQGISFTDDGDVALQILSLLTLHAQLIVSKVSVCLLLQISFTFVARLIKSSINQKLVIASSFVLNFLFVQTFSRRAPKTPTRPCNWYMKLVDISSSTLLKIFQNPSTRRWETKNVRH